MGKWDILPEICEIRTVAGTRTMRCVRKKTGSAGVADCTVQRKFSGVLRKACTGGHDTAISGSHTSCKLYEDGLWSQGFSDLKP